jgi:hypothetical protein
MWQDIQIVNLIMKQFSQAVYCFSTLTSNSEAAWFQTTSVPALPLMSETKFRTQAKQKIQL